MSKINRITESDVLDFDVDRSLDLYQIIATRSAIYPGQGTPIGVQYTALKLNGEAGELAEHVGKAMRDDYFGVTEEALTPERQELIIKEVGDCLWYLSAICNELGITLFQAAYTNLRKLASRTERGKLQGGGDNR